MEPKRHEVLIAIWPYAHDPMDAAIKFLTRGNGTHAAFIRGNGKIAENFWPHVHERGWKPGEAKKVELYRIQDSQPADWERFERWIDSELRHPAPYSIPDLFRYAINRPPAPGRQCFCSQWVLRGCRICLPYNRQPLVRLEYQDFASPRDLRISPRLIRLHVGGIGDDRHQS